MFADDGRISLLSLDNSLTQFQQGPPQEQAVPTVNFASF